MPSRSQARSALYRPLDRDKKEIRILQIHSGQPDGPLHCSMRTVSLLDEPVYEAISYTWGNPAVASAITINGKQLNVTTNLAAALRRFRCHDLPRRSRYRDLPRRLIARDRNQVWLWADAICINQADEAERGQQVPMMGDVFAQAHCVRVWLGDGMHGDEMDPSLVQAMNLLVSWDPKCVDEYVYEHYGIKRPPWSSEEDRCVARLLSVPYWRRTWIIQEVTLAHSTVWFCGDKELRMTAELADMLAWYLDQSTGPAYEAWIVTSQALYSGAHDVPSRRAVDLVHAAQSTHCADVRDHVYALMGLLPPLLDIRVSYTVSVCALYEEATFALMRAAGSLNLLAISIENFSDHGLSSWTFPFDGISIPTMTLPRSLILSQHQPWRGAAFKLERLCHGVIQIQGFMADTVAGVHRGIKERQTTSSLPHVGATLTQGWRKMYGQHITGQNSHPSSKTHLAFWFALRWFVMREEYLLQCFERIEHDAHSNDLAAVLLDVLHPDLLIRWSHLVFFTTSRGYIGTAVGPSSIRPGDEIYIVAGCGTLISLRRAEKTPESFVKMTPAYVVGMMDGEPLVEEAQRRYPGEDPDQHIDDLFETITLV